MEPLAVKLLLLILVIFYLLFKVEIDAAWEARRRRRNTIKARASARRWSR